MPGFRVNFLNNNDQVRQPPDILYNYIWDLGSFLGDRVSEENRLIYLRECDLPTYSLDTENVNTGHAEYKFASGIKWSDLRISFYATRELLRMLNDIAVNSKRPWTIVEGIGRAQFYMNDVTIRVFEAFDVNNSISWTLKNAWLKSVNYSNLTYENSGILNVNTMIAYSWAEITSS